MLAERVATGELPPIEERLPKQPFVVGPGILISEENLDWEVGTYGGTMETAHSNPGWNPSLFIMMNRGLLGAPGIGTADLTGNLYDDFSINEDNTVFTFQLREGLRWSDGEFVTTEDVRFAYEDVLLNTDLTPVLPRRWRDPSGAPMELVILDEYTFEISFQEPYGGFIGEITYMGWMSYSELIKPSHYLKPLHTTYTPLEDIEPLIEAQEMDNWPQFFGWADITGTGLTQPQAVGYPVLHPWIIVDSVAEILEFERNPYYYVVDTAGQQLPYIDRIISILTSFQSQNCWNPISPIWGSISRCGTSATPYAVRKLPPTKYRPQSTGHRSRSGGTVLRWTTFPVGLGSLHRDRGGPRGFLPTEPKEKSLLSGSGRFGIYMMNVRSMFQGVKRTTRLWKRSTGCIERISTSSS